MKFTKFIAYLILIGGLFVVSLPSQAQIDTEFWFVAPEVAQSHADRPIYLRISALDKAVNIEVSQPANPHFPIITQSINSNQTITIDLTSYIDIIENRPANRVLTNGLLIKSSASIMAYYEEAGVNNPEIFPLKGKNALGNLFYIPSQYSRYNQVGTEAFDIVATENNTRVTITPTIDIEGHLVNIPFQVNLQKGETFSARAIATGATSSLSGSKIVSNRPIAVTISDDSIYLNDGLNPNSVGGWDLIGDQLVPVNLLGNEHIVVRGNAGIGEEVYVLATEDNTEVKIAGNMVAMLNTGQSYRYALNSKVVYIYASKPSYVYHISGHPNELGSAIIPPVGCTGSKQIGFYRSSSGPFALMLLVKNGHQNAFTVDGNANLITESDFEIVPNSDNKWAAMFKDFSNNSLIAGSSHLIQNSKGMFHLGILNNLGGSSEYGYFSDFSSLDIGPDKLTSCQGNVITLDAGFGKEAYLWSDGSTEQTLKVTTAGKYWVKVTNGNCELYDEVTINFLPLPLVEIKNIPQEFCLESNPLTLQGQGFPAGGKFSVDGVQTSIFDPSILKVGKHEISYSYTNTDNCTNTAIHPIVINPPPTLAFLNLNAGYCIESPSFALEAQPKGGSFFIDNQAISVFNPRNLGVGTHRLTYTYINEKGCQNAIHQFVDVVGKPLPMRLKDSIFICPANREGVELKAYGGKFFEWNTHETHSIINVHKDGKYSVVVSNGYGCDTSNELEVFVKCVPVFMIPNAFSPNNDGLNDVFKVVGKDIYDLNLQVFNQWGELIFISQYKDEAWDGTFYGKEVPAGTYVWVATYSDILRPQDKFKKQGRITLLR